MDNEEFKLEKEIENESWFKHSQNIDIKKIKERLPSFKYFNDECNKLEKSVPEKYFNHVMAKANLFESQNAKILSRNGIPPKYMHHFLLKLYNLSEVKSHNYISNYELTFKKHSPKNLDDFVPYFTGNKTLKESLPIHFLNENGILALKEILWMINNNYANIEYSPLLIKIISLILIFCNKYETYEIITHLCENEYNLKETYKIRWHIRFNFNDNIKILYSISDCIKEISSKSGKEVYEYLTKINFDIQKLYEDMCFGFFLNYLNFYGILRLIPFFFIDGIKSIYRLTYAVEKVCKDTFLEINNIEKVIPVIRKTCFELNDINFLFELSYNFKLTRNNNKYDFQESPNTDLFKGKRNNYYLPKIDEESKIITNYEFIRLWEKIPLEFKMKDVQLIFSTSKDGYSLNTIIGLSEKYQSDNSILLILETQENEIFGFIISNFIKQTNNKFYRPLQSVLFTIKPENKIYIPDESDDIIYVDNDCLMFGNGPKGPAIRFDKDLDSGFSYDGGCFSNPVLINNEKGEFKIKNIEIFMLQ